MGAQTRRIAVNAGGTHVPGMNAVIAGVTLAADELGWEVVGIKDGFEALLFPDRYPYGGLLKLTPDRVEGLAQSTEELLGISQLDPFRVQEITPDGQRDQVDRSDDLMAALQDAGIEGVVSIVGRRALSLALKMKRKGLNIVCIPKSMENDVAENGRAFGYNSALSFCIESLDRIRAAAKASRRIVVVEVPGDHSGWLALQSAIAAYADAVLIPEIPFALDKLAARLTHKEQNGRTPALVVVAAGARPVGGSSLSSEQSEALEQMRRALSPGSSSDNTDNGKRVIEKTGLASKTVALALQRRLERKLFPVVLDHLVQGGKASVTDRQVGLAYGAAAVRGLNAGLTGTMVAFQPPGVTYIPLVEAINKVRRVSHDSELLLAARSLGIAVGD